MTDQDPILRHLDSGATVVTATRRQSRLWRRLHETAQRRAGRRVWRSADVLPLESWLERCWLEAATDVDAPQLLAPAEAPWPWRRRVRSHAEGTLLEERDLAAAARASWVALVAWGGSTGDLGGGLLTRDQQAFRDWALAVESDLRDRGWLDPALLPAALADRSSRFAPGARVLFTGFDRPKPQLRRLADAIVAAGGEASFVAAAPAATQAARFAAEHPQDELDAILDWLVARLRATPDALLGVVVPDLAGRRGSLARAFESALQPELELPGALERDRLVDFAGGPGLASVQVVGDALACLQTVAPFVETGQASRLLRSPYLGSPGEAQARLGLDLELRREGVFRLPLAALEHRARVMGAESLAQALAASRQLAQGPAQRRPGEWASAFGTLLKRWGWPVPRPLASDEFQSAERFRESLLRLAALDRVATPLDAAAARAELAELCAAPFQPERGDAQVLVYADFEPPGLPLDGLWVSGVTAAAWPRSPAPDPFLPVALQRRLGLPGSSAEATRDDALRVTAGWLGAARELVISWPAREDDAESGPSRLLPPGLEAHLREARLPGRDAAMLEQCKREPLGDDRVPALEAARARGGARIVELQAKCPFRAFAELRLGARPLEEPRPGVDRRSRGTVLHGALERAWRELRDSARLQSLDPPGRAALVRRCVAESLSGELAGTVAPEWLRLETEWQVAAVTQLLDLDATREPFEVVGLEAPLDRSLAGVPLRLRVDRIDRTAGGLVIVDYKTGDARTSHWRGDRPEAAQLPLYAVLAGEEVAAIAFAPLRASGARYRGVGDAAVGLPGLTPAERFRVSDEEATGLTWPEIRSRWAAWLAQLLEEHRAGVAAVDPKQPQTCRLCHLGTLCRVDRHAVDEEPFEDGTDD